MNIDNVENEKSMLIANNCSINKSESILINPMTGQ